MYDFLDKIGLKTALEAIKVKFPTSLPADGGNADKANAIVDYADANRIVKLGYAGQGLAPSQVMQFAAYTESTGDEVKIKDVSVENVKKVLGFWTGSDLSDANDAPEGISFAPMTGCANAPFDFWATILTLGGDVNSNYRQQIAFPWGRTDSYIMPRYRVKDSGVWEGWRTCGDIKPYITGNASVKAGSSVCNSEHGFIPSSVLFWETKTANNVYAAASFDSMSFTVNFLSDVDKNIKFIIFK